MLFLYSDDGSHFKHNKIPHKMTCDLVSVQGWPLNTGNKYSVCMIEKSGLEKWPLNRGWPFNTGPLYTGSTVKNASHCSQKRYKPLSFW